MKKITFIFFISYLLIEIFPQSNLVYHALIDQEIDLGLAPYIRRVINEAEQHRAKAIIFEINTFGGRVDAATQIKDAILESKILTIAFINKRAISAGALISLSCKKIIMAQGSSIGASTVVDMEGKKQSEKYQSYMRSEMRSTAEKNGRRTDIAEAMVDERVIIQGLDDSTTLVTLTSAEALKYKMCDTVVKNFDEMLKTFEFENANLLLVKGNWAEKIVSFLNNPLVSTLLMMIGLVGLYTEIKTGGWGIPGTIAVVALALFFGSSFILQIASMLEIFLFIVGVILLLIEIFLIPGFGVTGIVGTILIFGSLFFALFNTDFYFDTDIILTAIVQLGSALAGGIIIFALLIKYLPKSKSFSKMILADESASKQGFVANPNYQELLNKTGVSVTPLRPAGVVSINHVRYDVVTEGNFIEANKKIKVLKVEGMKIVVNTDEEI